MSVLLARHRAERPDEPALADEHRARSWASLDERVDRWVTVLRGQGLATGDVLAIVAGNRVEIYEALIACLHAGITVVPVNRHLTAPEVAYLLADSGAAGVLTDPACRRTAEEAAAPTVRARLVLGAPEELAAEAAGGAGGSLPVETLLADATPATEEPCCGSVMLYTSGTTGHPKGVSNGMFAVGGPMARVEVLLERFGGAFGLPGQGSTAALVGPWYHSAQLFFSLFPLLRGSRLVMRARFDAAGTLSLFEDERVTDCHLVPTQLVRMLRLDDATRSAFRGGSLERVWHGAGPCPPDAKRAVIDWWGPVLTEYYAATECGIVTLVDSPTWLAHAGTVGRPVGPTEVHALAPDGGELPAGEVGDLYVRWTDGRRFVYHGAPEKTAAAHRAEGFFTLGDRGYVSEDGYVYLTGRSGDTIISGGVNIYPAEVEAVLLAHPSVRDAAVVGVPDDEFGERVHAVVELENDTAGGGSSTAEVLDAHCRTHLAGFKVPRSYEVVEHLPREETGKIRRESLRLVRAGA